MRKFATADCETNPFKYMAVIKPFIWGFFSRELGFMYFFDTSDFVDFIRDYDGIIYMHNGGKFDLHFLFSYIEAQEDVMVINGRVAKIKIGKCEVRDSFLLLPVGLSAYKKDEIDYNKFEENKRSKHMAEIVSYLKGDCVYLYEILEKNFELYGQKLTLASSAFDFWHKKFSPYKYKPRTSASYFMAFKNYYYGGRVQCFKKGIINEPFEVWDINSAYPRAMLEEHPYGDEYKIERKLNENNLDRCFIRLNCVSNGVLPWRDKSGLLFPTDNQSRDYFATGHELKLGLEKGLIKINKIYSCTTFLGSINFREYVEHFYKQKAELKDIDEALYLLAKLYLNSLYGKFGQSSLDHRNYAFCAPDEIHGYIEAGYEFEDMVGNLAMVSCPIEPHQQKFYNVATAASITGWVRAYLYRHILAADTPIYCDTDSIAAKKLPCESGLELGQWSFEGNFKRGAIGGKKLYAFEREKAKKGELFKISSKGAKLNEKEIFAIARGEEILYKSNAPTFRIGKEPEYLTRKIRMT